MIIVFKIPINTYMYRFWVQICSRFEAENLSEKFCEIGPSSVRTCSFFKRREKNEL
jgi:hypothetical protein